LNIVHLCGLRIEIARGQEHRCCNIDSISCNYGQY